MTRCSAARGESPGVRIQSGHGFPRAELQGMQPTLGGAAGGVLRGDRVRDRGHIAVQDLDIRLQCCSSLVIDGWQSLDLLMQRISTGVDASVHPPREGQSEAFGHPLRRALRGALRAHFGVPFPVGAVTRTHQIANARLLTPTRCEFTGPPPRHSLICPVAPPPRRRRDRPRLPATRRDAHGGT